MKRLLVAVDGSPRSEAVYSAGVQLAKLAGAKLVLYRAFQSAVDVPRELLRVTDAPLEEILHRNADTELRRLVPEADAKFVERYVVEPAVAWDGICRAARELEADLVVIGAHGYGRLERLLGTTAGKVVNHLDRNVFVVRAPL